MRACARVAASDFRLWDRKTPCVIEGALAGWRAWTPALLRERIGAQPVMVAVSDESLFRYSAEVERDGAERAALFDGSLMPFSEAWQKISRGVDSGRYYYLMQRPIIDEFPSLVPELPELSGLPLPWIAAGEPTINLWFGQVGVVTPLHYDPHHNFLVQSYGRKRVTLFSPHDTHALYPLPFGSKMAHTSHVDVEHPDHARFPRFSQASAIEASLGAGDVLWLPAFWWHHVRTLELSVSINYWWPAPAEDCVVPNALRELPGEFQRDGLAEWSRENLAPMGLSFAQASRLCLASGIRWAAVLLAAADLAQRGGRLPERMLAAALASEDAGLAEVDMASLWGLL